MYEVILPNGDRAESDTIDGLMLAARTLLNESGDRKENRKGIYVTENGVYSGPLTVTVRTVNLS